MTFHIVSSVLMVIHDVQCPGWCQPSWHPPWHHDKWQPELPSEQKVDAVEVDRSGYKGGITRLIIDNNNYQYDGSYKASNMIMNQDTNDSDSIRMY